MSPEGTAAKTPTPTPTALPDGLLRRPSRPEGVMGSKGRLWGRTCRADQYRLICLEAYSYKVFYGTCCGRPEASAMRKVIVLSCCATVPLVPDRSELHVRVMIVEADVEPVPPSPAVVILVQPGGGDADAFCWRGRIFAPGCHRTSGDVVQEVCRRTRLEVRHERPSVEAVLDEGFSCPRAPHRQPGQSIPDRWSGSRP